MARPKDPDALQLVSLRLHPRKHIEYLDLWRPGGEIGDQVRDVIEFAKKFRPKGPDSFGYERDPAKTRQTSAVGRYASAHGISNAEAINMAWKAFEEARNRSQG